MLNLNSIINIPVYVSPLAAPRNDFSNFLIIGNSTHLSTSTRLKKYTSLAEMVADGFLTTDPEYIAASLFIGNVYHYFGTGAAFNLWVGVRGAAETVLEAVTACRVANHLWYACMVVGSDVDDADHVAVAAYVETASPATAYVVTSDAAGIPANTASNLGELLSDAGYNRTLLMYSTDQSDAYPNNIYATASLMGYAMGANTGLAGSAYTLAFKQLTGIYVEPLTPTQVTVLKSLNCNYYVSFSNYYNWLMDAKMAGGWYWDRLINLDMLTSNIQLNIADLLNGNPKIPQTDYGAAQMIRAVNAACDDAVKIGFLAPGTWNGAQVLNLSPGDPLPKGYIVQAESLATQLQADREARLAPNLYVSIKEAGAIQGITIGVYVNA